MPTLMATLRDPILIQDQYPDEWFLIIVNHTLENIIYGIKFQLKTTPREHKKEQTVSHD